MEKPTLAPSKTKKQKRMVDCEMPWRLANQMPYEYSKINTNVPQWAETLGDKKLWTPLRKRSNTRKFFANYRVGVYELIEGKWKFELEGENEFHGAWVPGEKTFECEIDVDDPNNPDYYLAADAESGVIAVVFVPGDFWDCDEQWSLFETEELYSRMTVMAWTKPRPLPQSWAESKTEVIPFDIMNPKHKPCLTGILQHKTKIEIKSRLNEIYFLTSWNKTTETEDMVAYALVSVRNQELPDTHLCAEVLVSCAATFEPAHQLLYKLGQQYKLPAFPLTIEKDIGYWEPRLGYLVDDAIRCIGWDHQHFLEQHVDGYWEAFGQVSVGHHLFM